jgi:hypothetical protein
MLAIVVGLVSAVEWKSVGVANIGVENKFVLDGTEDMVAVSSPNVGKGVAEGTGVSVDTGIEVSVSVLVRETSVDTGARVNKSVGSKVPVGVSKIESGEGDSWARMLKKDNTNNVKTRNDHSKRRSKEGLVRIARPSCEKQH